MESKCSLHHHNHNNHNSDACGKRMRTLFFLLKFTPLILMIPDDFPFFTPKRGPEAALEEDPHDHHHNHLHHDG